jgi:ribose-phosphate pyrophosphokinase
MPIYVNKELVKTFKFPGGEWQVELNNKHQVTLYETYCIRAFLYNSDDIICLLLTVDALRRANKEPKFYLEIPYFPYARQDRVCNNGEALSVKVMADLINNLNCTQVRIYDPHSDVVGALINNVDIMPLERIFAVNSAFHFFLGTQKYDLVSPDAGAEKKVRALANKLSVGAYYAYKSRNTLTGEITSVRFDDDVLRKNLLIVDDICDGGRTFIQLADRLIHNGAVNVCLYVTHGIFSKGLDILRPHLSHIYCYHTFLHDSEIDPKFLTVLSKES